MSQTPETGAAILPAIAPAAMPAPPEALAHTGIDFADTDPWAGQGRMSLLQPQARRAFVLWLKVLLGLTLLMVAVGGLTRLTGSGLSITEWRPVTGAIPPLREADWLAEFARYRQSPQYLLLNAGMSLADFKFIYAWEWGHRQLGRLIGLVMLGGFLWFWLRGVIKGKLAALTFALGLLLGLQGTVGWIMVASGLKPGMIAVAPVKLMLHLVFASVFFAALVWLATKLGGLGGPKFTRRGVKRGAGWLVVAVLAQLALGALVAGSRAGLTYNTWPLMDGALIPSAGNLFVMPSFWENFVDNPTLVQFNHRLGAYLLGALSVWHFYAARGTDAQWGARHLVYALAGQIVLGIITLVLVVPLWAGMLHQIMGLLVLFSAVRHWARLVALRAGEPVARSG